MLQKVKRGIARLIDAYSEGLLDKSEFEPRVRRAKERLAELEKQAKVQADLEEQQRELRLVIGRLQEFAERVREGLNGADWSTRREIIRTLVKRVEIGDDDVRVIYRVDVSPFVEGPEGGRLPYCWRSHDDMVLQMASGQQRILLTEDKDFGELVVRLKLPVYGIILLRMNPADSAAKLRDCVSCCCATPIACPVSSLSSIRRKPDFAPCRH